MTVRLGVVSAVVAPALIAPLAAVLGSGLILGLGVTLWGWRRLHEQGELPMPEVTNPTEIRTAVTFGLIYGAVLLVSAWLQDLAGSKGLFLVALVSGFTDVDAAALSALRLYNLEKITQLQAVVAIVLALLSNLAFKIGLVVAIGGAALTRQALPGLLAIGLGLGAGIAMLA